MPGKTRIITAAADVIPLPDASVDLVVTSPPYWMLREYRDGGQRLEGQIGQEPRWEDFIDSLVRCTREWVRVLKPTGSLWVNLGDKYGRGTRTTIHGGHSKQAYVDGDRPGVCTPSGYEKSLIGLPWRYAIRCTDELDLKLRAEVIWSKTNGLPESVQDRVRRSHEHFFHFTKQERYYSAIDDIRVDHSENTNTGRTRTVGNESGKGVQHRTFAGNTDTFNPDGKLPGSVWEVASESLAIPDYVRGALGEELDHYAAFPTALVRPVIKAFSPRDVCTACKQGRFPVEGGYACSCTPFTDHLDRRAIGWHEHQETRRDTGGAIPVDGGQVRANGVREATGPVREYHLRGWTPPPSRRGVVLDPFGGPCTAAPASALTCLAIMHVSLPGGLVTVRSAPRPWAQRGPRRSTGCTSTSTGTCTPSLMS